LIPESDSGRKVVSRRFREGTVWEKEKNMEEKERRGRLGLGAYKYGNHFRMTPDREGFREEIRPVAKRFYKWYGEFEKRNSLSDPVETLIHRFGFFGYNSLGGKANSTFIVTKYRGRWLRIANVFEGEAFRYSKLGIGTHRGQLCLSSRGDFDRDASGDAVDGGVDEVGGVVPKGVEASSFGAGVREREIGGAGMDLEEHGRWADDTAMVGEFSKVAKQSFMKGKNGGSRFRLEGGEGSDSFKSSDVVGSGIAQGRANDFLKLSGLSGGGRGGGAGGGKLRGGGSIDGRDIDGGEAACLTPSGRYRLSMLGT
jgi:hypothetical protein